MWELMVRRDVGTNSYPLHDGDYHKYAVRKKRVRGKNFFKILE